jgi:hypothetical protein
MISSVGNGLPDAIKPNTIYYSIPNYSKEDCQSLAEKMFFGKSFQKEQTRFVNDFFSISHIASKFKSTGLFTLNEFRKFIQFREITSEILPYSFIIQMLFIYKFSDFHDLLIATKAFKFNLLEFWPNFQYKENCFIASPASSSTQEIFIPSIYKIPSDNILESIQSFSLSQRHCLIF